MLNTAVANAPRGQREVILLRVQAVHGMGGRSVCSLCGQLGKVTVLRSLLVVEGFRWSGRVPRAWADKFPVASNDVRARWIWRRSGSGRREPLCVCGVRQTFGKRHAGLLAVVTARRWVQSPCRRWSGPWRRRWTLGSVRSHCILWRLVAIWIGVEGDGEVVVDCTVHPLLLSTGRGPDHVLQPSGVEA